MLFEAFEKSSKQEWIDKATADLKGTPVLDKYQWALNDDIKLSPYYAVEDLEGLEYLEKYRLNPTVMGQADGNSRSWINEVNVIVDNEKTANSEAILSLMNGADGINFVVKDGSIDLALLLNDILLEHCHVTFTVQKGITKVANQYIEFAKLQQYALSKINGCLIAENQDQDTIKHLLSFNKHFPLLKTISISGNSADVVEELSGILSKTTNLFNQLISIGQVGNLFGIWKI